MIIYKSIYFCLALFGSFLFANSTIHAQFQSIQGVNYADVKINDPFWSPKVEDVSKKALGVCIYQTEVATPRIKNYEKVAAAKGERHEGIYYDDSDVYKAIEAMAYSLHTIPDPVIEAKADEWIEKIAAAQLEDGYLNTYYTLEELENRWTDMERHEAYCAGHLIEAAIAYYQATGKRKLLDVAIRFADHIDNTLRLANKPWVAGHQEIELALVKLYRVTGNTDYLKLAEWFLDQRGRGYGVGMIWDRWKDPAYCQDAVPVKEQSEITGHAVRAMYMYTGIADVAAITEDDAYLQTMLRVWEDVVHRNTYVTGGIGSAGRNEGFSVDYDLPNEEAYCETCASVGMVFWNQRMNWLTGESKYIDVLERSLYNSALDGISLDGSQFFYPNPLASSGQHSRRDWFGTACCPSNISRLITSIGNYIYGERDGDIWINLFIGSQTTIPLADADVQVSIQTEYPWNNSVRVMLNPSIDKSFKVHIRIPGWSRNEVLPGGLYHYVHQDNEVPILRVNGKNIPYTIEKGYTVVERSWKHGDKIELQLPIKPRLIAARPEVSENKGRMAIQYGPLVYCVEGADNNGQVKNILLPESAEFKISEIDILDERVHSLVTELPVFNPDSQARSVVQSMQTIRAIPYYTWCNRGSNDMLVWLPARVNKVRID